jgi:diguanylate cyclase (GGDEF)-like protein/PAS domain S-box-containing protein
MREYIKKDNRIAKRLIIGVVLFSTFLTLLTTSIQLYLDYRHSVAAIDESFYEIEVSSLPTIINNVWIVDRNQIQIQLDSLEKLQNIKYLAILVNDQVRWQAGNEEQTNIIERRFVLEYAYRGKIENIGTLQVQADLNEVYEQLFDKILIILVSNALKTFLVAGFIILFFHFLVSRHLYRLLESFQNFQPHAINKPLVYNRQKKSIASPDELDLLALAFNQLQKNTTDSYQKLVNEKEKLQITLNSIIDGVIVCDAYCAVELVNPVAQSLIGCKNNEVFGQQVSAVFNVLHEKTRKSIPDLVQKAVSSGTIQYSKEPTVLVSHTGSEKAIKYTVAPIVSADGDILGSILVFHDVTSSRKLNQELMWNASHDPLTRLPNRREFERQLSHAIPKDANDVAAHIILFIDLDQFKVVNDSCGHAAGDELLRQLTALLELQIRKNDLLARLGGDEFGVILHDCSKKKGLQIAEKMRQVAENFRFIWNDKPFRIGASIGVVCISERDSVKNYIHHADTACYEAKARGRNRIHLYHQEDGVVKEAELEWVTRISQAMDKNQFELYVQPIICGQSLAVHHYEILIRMVVDEQIIYPNEFIPPAERYGIMSNIDRWVVSHTFDWLKQHVDDAPKVAINLSGSCLSDIEFSQFVADQFDDGLVQGHQVCFEITETAAIANISQALSLISNLKELGCSFALDDFGSGLSSFAYLKNFPVDYLKIDGSFVRDMVDDPIDQAMVQAIHQVGKVMDIQTIAEYVENDALIKACQNIGINFLQGYGIGKPVPITSLVFNKK